MKIICMDCQNESYSDMESLKANRRFVCARCEEKARAYSDKQVEAYQPLAMHEPLVSYPGPLDELPVSSEIEAQNEEVLEIADEIFIHEQPGDVPENDVILLPEIEAQAMPSVEGLYFEQSDDTLQNIGWPTSENNSDPVSAGADFAYTLPERETELSSESPLPNAFPVQEAKSVTRARLMSFSMPKQIVIAGACVLSIISMQTFLTPSGQVGIKAESPNKSISAPAPVVERREVKEAPPPSAPVAQNSPTPVPSPAVVSEEKPQVATPPTTEQPAEKQKGLFTLQVGSHQGMAEANEQAEKFRAAGFEPHVVSAEIPKRGTWYRVQVGDFSTRDEANSFGAMLRSKGLVESFIVSGL